jgi:hypothetical protein
MPSLLESLVACTILTVGVLSLAQLFALAAALNVSSRQTSHAAVLAAQKIEELRTVGAVLMPSPPSALSENTAGYVDYVDRTGDTVGAGSTVPPDGAVYIRRWSIDPLATDPLSTVVIQVFVTPHRERPGSSGAVRHSPGEVRLVTAARTRRAP